MQRNAVCGQRMNPAMPVLPLRRKAVCRRFDAGQPCAPVPGHTGGEKGGHIAAGLQTEAGPAQQAEPGAELPQGITRLDDGQRRGAKAGKLGGHGQQQGAGSGQNGAPGRGSARFLHHHLQPASRHHTGKGPAGARQHALHGPGGKAQDAAAEGLHLPGLPVLQHDEAVRIEAKIEVFRQALDRGCVFKTGKQPVPQALLRSGQGHRRHAGNGHAEDGATGPGPLVRQQHAGAAARCGEGAGHSRRAAADDDDIVKGLAVSVHHCLLRWPASPAGPRCRCRRG